MKVEIEISKLSEILAIAAQRGATLALEQTGAIATTITLAEVKKLYGKPFAKAARMAPAVRWMPVGSGGRSSGVYAKRSEVDKFLFEIKFDFNA